MLRSMMYVTTPSGCSLRRSASASMPMPMRSSERKRSRACCLVRLIAGSILRGTRAGNQTWWGCSIIRSNRGGSAGQCGAGAASGAGGIDELQRLHRGYHARLGSVLEEQAHAFELVAVQRVVDVFREVGFDVLFADADARRPFACEFLDVLGEQSVVARGLKDFRQVEIVFLERSAANRPEGEDERLARLLFPFFREVDAYVL